MPSAGCRRGGRRDIVTRRWSLRTRFVATALACLLPLLGVVLYVLEQSLEHSRDQLVDAEVVVGDVVARGLTGTLEDNQDVLEALAATDEIRSLDPGQSTQILTQYLLARPSLYGLFVVDATGAGVATAGVGPEAVRADIQSALERTIGLGEPGVSGRLTVPEGEASDVIAITVPVQARGEDVGVQATGSDGQPVGGNGQAVGAVGALLSVERLESTFFPFARGETSITVVTEGQVIASRPAEREGDNLTARLAEPIALAVAGDAGQFSYEDATGAERLAVYTPVEFLGAKWAVLVSNPSPTTYGPNRSLLQNGLAALAAAVVATLLLAVSLGEVTARPLRRLTAQAAALARGDFTQRIEPAGGGEIRSLSAAFRTMEDRLADQMRDLEAARTERETQAVELRDLHRRTVRLQEDERRRIAAEIHDAVSPLITGALYQARALQMANGSAEAAARQEGLGAVGDLLERATKELHGVIFDLRPPDLDDIGVVAAIERYVNGVQRTGLTCRLEVIGEPPSLPPEVRVGIYRIVQEALHNVVRHASADEAMVRLETLDRPETGERLLRVAIRDNGIGFDPERAVRPTSLGLLSMRERAAAIGASFRIVAQPGGGTAVVIERPVTQAAPSDLALEAEPALAPKSPPVDTKDASAALAGRPAPGLAGA